jgi:outer membrane protein OmpA-like peptidoglycan-associated protein
LSDADKEVVAKTMAALALKPDAIVLLSGFHDPSGDAATNATLAKARAGSVRDALVAGGVAGERIKFRKPESTVGSGSAQEGRRVEIRVQ